MKLGFHAPKHILFFLSLILISAQVFGQKFFMPEGVVHKKLDNGFSYYLLPQDGERGKITVHLVSNIGSLVELPEERGVAHFIEHMVFKGSKNYPGEETMLALDKMGLRIGRDYNASVNSTKTEYHINLPEDNWTYLQQTLLLMKDWVGDLQMEDASFRVEQKVVIEEIKKRNSSVSPYLNGTVLEGHGGLGTEDQINDITSNQVKAFYKKHYTPNKFVLIVQGKINEKKVVKFIDKIFSEIPKSNNGLQKDYIDLTTSTVVDSHYVSTIKNSKPVLALAFKTPSYAIDSREAFKKNFIQYLFCKILENRLTTYSDKSIDETSVTKGEILPGSMMYNVRLQGSGNVSYTAMLDNFCKAVAEARTYGFTQAEIDFFADEFIKRIKTNIKEDKVTLSEAETHFLSGDIPLSSEAQYRLLTEFRDSLIPTDFNGILNSFTENQKTILFDNTSNLYNSGFTEAFILNKLKHINDDYINLPKYKFVAPTRGFVVKNKPNLPNIELEAKTPVSITNKKTIGMGLYLLEYKNGISVVVNNAPTVTPKIRIVSKHGLDVLPKADRQIFTEALNLFNTSFGGRSDKESAKVLREYLFSKKTDIDGHNFELELRSNNELLNYENLLKAFHLLVAEDNQPDIAVVLEKLKTNKSLDSLDKTDFNEALVKRMFEYNQVFTRNFRNAYVYVGGDLPKNIDTLISTYIATIPSLEKPDPISKFIETVKPISPKYVEDQKVKTQSRASFIFEKQYDKQYAFKDALIAEAIAEYGYDRIFEILRKKYGLIYALGTTGNGEKQSKTSLVSLRYIADNTNLQRCKQIMAAEILAPMSKGEITDENVEIAKAKLTTKLGLYFYDDEVVSDVYLKKALEYGKLFTLQELNNEVNKITSKDLKEGMKSMISLENL